VSQSSYEIRSFFLATFERGSSAPPRPLRWVLDRATHTLTAECSLIVAELLFQDQEWWNATLMPHQQRDHNMSQFEFFWLQFQFTMFKEMRQLPARCRGTLSSSACEYVAGAPLCKKW
jgi:hypothetical protein